MAQNRTVEWTADIHHDEYPGIYQATPSNPYDDARGSYVTQKASSFFKAGRVFTVLWPYTVTWPKPLGTPRAMGRTQLTLPMWIDGRTQETLADTGADANCMSQRKARELGLTVQPVSSNPARYRLANGKVVPSLGEVTTTCAFEKESFPTPFAMTFSVFKHLVEPIVIGLPFLKATETLTVNASRMVRKLVKPLQPRRLMHLSSPQQGMHCYLDFRPVIANPDTGADMNLVSPAFARRHRFGKHFPTERKEMVQFADGSIGYVTNPTEAAVSLDGVNTIRATFHVLKGLTSDVLIGGDVLQESEAYTKHSHNFVNANTFDEHGNFNTILWLGRRGRNILAAFRQSRGNRTDFENLNEDDVDLRDVSDDELDASFWEAMSRSDGYESHRHEQALQNISRMQPGSARDAAETKEKDVRILYQQKRKGRIRRHEDRLRPRRDESRSGRGSGTR